ncbi:uncharacterized protein LOC119733867 [Patiria miniata]|uniref:CCHC-type domain-containing protein n=1 Tax=Patiria miniata TaxID=46514 RepID=A0A914AHZ5_PATMI|nr:uncharacterized protein LOC119733867 [Patiria miniata]
MVGFDITDDTRKKALLLHYGGEELQDIYDTLKSDSNDYAAAKKALTDYFAPKKNVVYETIIFRRTKQNTTENIHQYCTRLRQQAVKCDFSDIDRELKTQIIEGCTSKHLRRKSLEKDRNLTELLELARSLSLSESRAHDVEADGSQTAVNKVAKPKRNFKKPTRHDTKPPKRTCFYCGGSYPHKNQCPAKGHECSKCGKQDHFEKVCRSDKQRKNTPTRKRRG